MISFLRGTVVELLPMRLVIEVAGVGYDVLIPLSTYDKLPQPGATAKVLISERWARDDVPTLIGFATADERDLFQLLVNNVSGMGSRGALAVLNGISPLKFRAAVVATDASALTFKGVSKKMAERIIVELRDKVGVSAAWEAASAAVSLTPAEAHVNDAVLALISLGYKQVDAHKAVRALHDKNPGAKVEDLVKDALKAM